MLEKEAQAMINEAAASRLSDVSQEINTDCMKRLARQLLMTMRLRKLKMLLLTCKRRRQPQNQNQCTKKSTARQGGTPF